MRLCHSEHQLFHHFFGATGPGLYTMLEQLGGVLYDASRPRVIKTVSLDTLVDLCAALRSDGAEDRGEAVAAFASIAEQMLQDVQQRLVFVAQGITIRFDHALVFLCFVKGRACVY